jgi:hypothetical protein
LMGWASRWLTTKWAILTLLQLIAK